MFAIRLLCVLSTSVVGSDAPLGNPSSLEGLEIKSFSKDAFSRPSGVEPILKATAGARIIGLGEASHGTHEFAVLRTAIILLLAQKGRLAFVGLEANYGECLPINRYVKEGIGDAKKLVTGLSQWPWRTTEMLELIEALRTHNSRISDPNKRIAFIGVDVQSVEALLPRLRQLLPDSDSQSNLATLERLYKEGNPYGPWGYAAISACSRLEAALGKVQPSTETQMLSMSLTKCRLMWSEPSIEPAVRERDKGMAEMTLYASSLFKTGVGCLWLHNGHAMVFEQEIAPKIIYKTLGKVLSERIGSGYYALATSFMSGEVLAFDPSERKLRTFLIKDDGGDMLDTKLAQTNPYASFINFRSRVNRKPFKSTEWKFRQIEAVLTKGQEAETVVSDKLGNLYDGFFSFSATTPLTLLKRD